MKCPHNAHEMQISNDGMTESLSSNVTLDVFSSRASNCQVVFPHRIIKPFQKTSINHKEQLNLFLMDIIEDCSQITTLIADNLKRATCKNSLNHASTFPCEYCFARGTRLQLDKTSVDAENQIKLIQEKIASVSIDNEHDMEQLNLLQEELETARKNLHTNKRSRIVWPASSIDSEPRTVENVMTIVEKIAEKGKLPPNEAKGIVGKSPLFIIPNFDFVRDAPTEYLHSVCLGVVKRMVELTFSVGEARKRVTKRKLSNPETFNLLIKGIKSPREFPRRIRDLDFGVYKGQEFRNLVLFFFPLVIQCIGKGEKERNLWLLLVYMIRSCILPNDEFKQIDLDILQKLCHDFYVLYEKIMGLQNCTYNTHVVSSHLIEMRYHGPLTLTSAFGFESFYGEIRNSFTPGTQSTLKQIFKKILIKRALGYHCCQNSIYFSAHETPLESNCLIYIYQDMTHKIFKIVEKNEDQFVCVRQGKYPAAFSELPNLEWGKVGIYKKGPISEEKVNIKREQICGKVLQVQNLLITCPNNVLREK